MFRPYPSLMTKLLEKALDVVRRLPPDSQGEIALAMLTLSGMTERQRRSIPRIFPRCWKGLRKPSAANSQPMSRSKPCSVASSNEARRAHQFTGLISEKTVLRLSTMGSASVAMVDIFSSGKYS